MRVKEEETKKLLLEYDKMSDEGKLLWGKVAKDRKNLYSTDYLGVSKRTGKATFNYLVKIADKRAYDVTRKEYIDDITIRRGIESIESSNITVVDNINTELQGVYEYFVSEFNKDNNFERKMRLLYSINSQYPDFLQSYSNSPLQCIIPITYQNYINLLGFERIKALGYYESAILGYIQSQQNLQNSSIASLFSVGDKYTTKQIKEILASFYSINSISKTPKASDLNDYYILKSIKLKVGDKWENRFEIIKRKR